MKKEYKELLEDLKEMFLNKGFISVLELDNYLNNEGYSDSIFDDTGYFDNEMFSYGNDEVEFTIYFENVKGDLEVPREVFFKVEDVTLETI